MKHASIAHPAPAQNDNHQQPESAAEAPVTKGGRAPAQSPQTAEILAKGHANPAAAAPAPAFTEDKRETARHEHSNHFTNRAPKDKQ